MPFFNGNSMPFTGTLPPGYNPGPGDRGFMRNAPMGDGPWNNGPWNNGAWSNGTPFNTNWFRPSDPKGTMTNGWDEMLNAPGRMGRMPGGWRAPSISVPNPVDVGEQFSDAARDLPQQMRDMNFSN